MASHRPAPTAAQRGSGRARRSGTARIALAVGLVSVLAAPSCEYPDYVFAAAGGAAGMSPLSGGTAGASGGESATGGTAGSGGSSGTGGNGASAGALATAGAAGEANGSAGAAGASNLLFSDDFEDGDASGWVATNGTWSVVGTGGDNAYVQSSTLDEFVASAASVGSWADVVIEADVKVLNWGDGSTSTLAGLYARFAGIDNHYYFALRGDQKVAIRKKVAGSNTTIGTPTAAALIETGISYHLKFEVIGTTLSAYIDDAPILSFTDSDITAAGPVALGTDFTTAEFDNIVVRAP